jgi:hypothetical protein
MEVRMTHWKRAGSIFATAILLTLGLSLSEARDAEAHGGRGGRGFIGGFYGPYFGFGFGPWGAYGPWGGPWGGPWWGYRSGNGIDTMAIAKMTGWGAVDLNVKPNRADVWVDGKYVSEARDLDGDPSYLWLEKGPHRLTIYKGGYKSFDEDIDVERGVLKSIKVRLEPGNSPPPLSKPSDKKEQDKKPQDEKSREGSKDDQTD